MIALLTAAHGPAHLLVECAAESRFQWDPRQHGWERPGLPVLSNLAGPIQLFRPAVLGAWRGKVAADQEGLSRRPWLDFHGTLQLLNSDHVRERDKALLRSILVGGVWNGSLLGRCPCWWSFECLSAGKGEGSACAVLVMRWY